MLIVSETYVYLSKCSMWYSHWMAYTVMIQLKHSS